VSEERYAAASARRLSLAEGSDVPEQDSETAEAAFIRQCEEDYGIAEVTAAAHVPPGRKTFTNILTVVELLHRELEPNPLLGLPPERGGYPRRLNLGRRAGTLYVHRWAPTVPDALRWYRGCFTGTMLVPGTAEPTTVDLGVLDSDPPWPHLAVETREFWEHSSFWGKRPGGSRWHRLITRAPVEVGEGWNASDFERARTWLLNEVHVDPFARCVLLGSCHLLLPNPVYRRLTTRVDARWQRVEVHLSPWAGADVSTLELVHWNRRAWGATSVVRVPLRSGENVVSLPEGVETVAHAVACAKRGLLEQSEAASFMASVEFGLSVATERRTVHVPKRSGRAPAETYTIGVAHELERTRVGEPRAPNALARLAEDESQQSAGELWKQLRVRWFDGDPTAGGKAVRDIIGSARRTVRLLDPYFSRNDLLRFGLATSIHRLPVQILTSAEFCEQDDDELNVENGEALLTALESVRHQDPRLSIDVRVMLGRKSPVHDRFLIVDETVWVLGASLNEFGDRGSLLLRLPPPPARATPDASPSISIERDVFLVRWGGGDDVSPTLEDWVRRRRTGRRSMGFLARIRRSAELIVRTTHRIHQVWRA
jgi:hypothetical protein